MYNYLKFTGDYSALQSMGYKFQKLYANNYMSWSKNGIFIFKKGADITHGEIDLYKLVKFLRTDPVVMHRPSYISFFKFYDEDERNYEYRERSEENINRYRDNISEWRDWDNIGKSPQYISTIAIERSLLHQLEELRKLGWYELASEEHNV